MKIVFFIATTLLCIGWGITSDDKSKTAVTGFPTPIYDGMISATTGSITSTIPPQTLVYVQNFTLDVNNQTYVKIFVNDTLEGYVPENWLLVGGKLGVINASEKNPVAVFDDEEGQVDAGMPMTELQLIAFKNISNEASQIIYRNDKDQSRPFIGYIRVPVTSDSLSMAFFQAYYDANQKMRYENNPAPMAALNADQAFEMSSLRQEVFGAYIPESMEGFSEESSDKHTGMEWEYFNDKQKISDDDLPGKFVLHYIWEDSTESSGNHLGDDLEQGRPLCGEEKEAMGYKMLFTPSKASAKLVLKCSMPSLGDDGKRQIEFQNVEPGNVYELVILANVYTVVCDETTFIVETDQGTGKGMVTGSCGD